MKKFLCLLMALIMSLSLFACSSKKAAALEEKISALGEITIESGTALAEAENLLAGLSGKEKTQVSNLDLLQKARLDYDAIVCRHQAEELETIIHDLRPITLKSKENLREVEEEYNSADVNVKLQVKNFDDLVTGFQAYRMIRIDLVEKKIAAIGAVTLEKADQIALAREAFDELDEEEQSWVYNTYVLVQAEKDLDLLQHPEKDAE